MFLQFQYFLHVQQHETQYLKNTLYFEKNILIQTNLQI